MGRGKASKQHFAADPNWLTAARCLPSALQPMPAAGAHRREQGGRWRHGIRKSSISVLSVAPWCQSCCLARWVSGDASSKAEQNLHHIPSCRSMTAWGCMQCGALTMPAVRARAASACTSTRRPFGGCGCTSPRMTGGGGQETGGDPCVASWLCCRSLLADAGI